MNPKLKFVLWGVIALIAIAPQLPRPSSALTAAERIQNRISRVSGYRVIDAEKRLNQQQFSTLGYVAPGNSAAAMHRRFGLPHGTNGKDEEYYPVVTTDQTYWVAAQYRGHIYTGYRFVQPRYNLTQYSRVAEQRSPLPAGAYYQELPNNGGATVIQDGGSGSASRPWGYRPKLSQRSETQRRWARGY